MLKTFGPRAKEAMPALRAALKDSDPQVAAEAACALLNIATPDPEAVKCLVRSIGVEHRRFPDLDVGLSSIKALGPKAAGSAPALIGLLNESNQTRVVQIAEALYATAPEQAQPAVPHVMKILRDDQADYHDQEAAFSILWNLGPSAKEAVPVLIERLTKPHALGNEYWKIGGILKAIGPAARPALPTLRRMMEDDHELWWVTDALITINPNDPVIVPSVMAVLKYPEEHLREWAVDKLASLGSASRPAIPRFRDALQQESRPVLRDNIKAAIWQIEQCKP